MSLSQASADAIIVGINDLQSQKTSIVADIEQKQRSIATLEVQRNDLQSKINTINSNIDGINKDCENMKSQADTIDKDIAIMTQDLADGGYKL